MEQIEIRIDDTLVDAIEEKQIFLSSLEHLLGFAYSTKEYNIPQEKIDKLTEEYHTVYVEYSLLKNKIEEYFPPEIKKKKSKWELDFDSGFVTVTINDEEKK